MPRAIYTKDHNAIVERLKQARLEAGLGQIEVAEKRGKSDYIGGVFDRWINIIPESVIFNKYFLPKIADNLEVISDYYEYDPKKSGIAPDVLGVKIGTKA